MVSLNQKRSFLYFFLSVLICFFGSSSYGGDPVQFVFLALLFFCLLLFIDGVICFVLGKLYGSFLNSLEYPAFICSTKKKIIANKAYLALFIQNNQNQSRVKKLQQLYLPKNISNLIEKHTDKIKSNPYTIKDLEVQFSDKINFLCSISISKIFYKTFLVLIKKKEKENSKVTLKKHFSWMNIVSFPICVSDENGVIIACNSFFDSSFSDLYLEGVKIFDIFNISNWSSNKKDQFYFIKDKKSRTVFTYLCTQRVSDGNCHLFVILSIFNSSEKRNLFENKYLSSYMSEVIPQLVLNQNGKVLFANSAWKNLLENPICENEILQKDFIFQYDGVSLNVSQLKSKQFSSWNIMNLVNEGFSSSVCVKVHYHEDFDLIFLFCELSSFFKHSFIRDRAEILKSQAVQSFASGVAHELNNFLTTISFVSDEILLSHQANILLRKSIKNIKDASIDASKIIKSIMRFTNRNTAKKDVYDLYLITQATILDFSKSVPMSIDLIYEKNIQKNLFVYVDFSEMKISIHNILTNSLEALENSFVQKKFISISIDYYKNVDKKYGLDQSKIFTESVVIEICDNGEGINKKDLSRIFDPFFTTKNSSLHTGFGLSVSNGIVASFGGDIQVFVDENKTCFFIILPVFRWSEQSEKLLFQNNKKKTLKIEEQNEKIGNDEKKNKKCILFIEDYSHLRSIIEQFLVSAGYNVVAKESCVEALEFFKKNKNKIDIIVSDITMPVLDGLSFVESIYMDLKNKNVIFISGYSKEYYKSYILDSPFVTLLQKPFGLKKLTDLIESKLNYKDIKMDEENV